MLTIESWNNGRKLKETVPSQFTDSTNGFLAAPWNQAAVMWMHQQRGGRAIPIRTQAPRLHVWLNICSSALQLCSNKWANKRGGRWNDQIFHFKAFVRLDLSSSSFSKCLGIRKSEIWRIFFNNEGHIMPFIRWMTRIRSPALSVKTVDCLNC